MKKTFSSFLCILGIAIGALVIPLSVFVPRWPAVILLQVILLFASSFLIKKFRESQGVLVNYNDLFKNQSKGVIYISLLFLLMGGFAILFVYIKK